MEKERNTKALHVKVPEQLYDELQEMAARKYVSLAALVRLFCRDGLGQERLREGRSTAVRTTNEEVPF
jgi:metal-responsive CopG/Arc/MetJ family transcriptional regulator